MLDDVSLKVVLYKNMSFNESVEYKKTFIGSGVGTGSMQVLHGFEFEVEPLGDHTFEVEPQENVDKGASLQEVQTQDLMVYQLTRDMEQHFACELFVYREDNNEAAFAVAAVDKIYAHKSLTFNDTVVCEAISKWKARLKGNMDVRSNVYVLSNGCRKCSDDDDGYYWEYIPVQVLQREVGTDFVGGTLHTVIGGLLCGPWDDRIELTKAQASGWGKVETRRWWFFFCRMELAEGADDRISGTMSGPEVTIKGDLSQTRHKGFESRRNNLGNELHKVCYEMRPVGDIAGGSNIIVSSPWSTDISGFPSSLVEDKLKIQILELQLPLNEVGLPDGCENFDLIPSASLFWKLFAAAGLMKEQAENMLRGLTPTPSCIISDNLFPWTSDLARKFNIPRLVFHGPGCFSFLCIHVAMNTNVLDDIESDSEYSVLPGILDRIELTKVQASSWGRKDIKEAAEFFEIAKDNKVWCIGPVSLCNKSSLDIAERGNNTPFDEHACLKWLDSREPRSVIFVCLGSLARASTKQNIELGLGLEASNSSLNYLFGGGEAPKPALKATQAAPCETLAANNVLAAKPDPISHLIDVTKQIPAVMMHLPVKELELTIDALGTRESDFEPFVSDMDPDLVVKCIILSEANDDLKKELSFVKDRVRCLETSLHQMEEAKKASAKDISRDGKQ
nr:UDP-glycosyltransferase 73E1-like [Tanacetum cinerariifolium]